MNFDFNAIWGYSIPILGGVTVGGIIIAIGSMVFKTISQKALAKLDIEKIEEKAVEKGVEKVKTYTFKHNIQPIVKSELQKVVEVVDDKVDEKLDKVDKRYNSVIDCLEKLASYFDNSIGVPEEKKLALKESIAKAKIDDYSLETLVVEEEVKKPTKVAQNGSNAPTSNITVER